MTEPLLTADSDLLEDDLFIKPQKKNKILFLSDHPLAPSGVGVQARFLIEGLLQTGRYSFRCLGGAIKHQDYRTIKVNDDFVIKPVDGFGTHEMIRSLLVTEKPDAVFIFTDPRQFIWLWEIEDEIHQVCPIVYWHVWDNDPYPAFNRPWYESTDLINCLSKKTYDLIYPHFPEKTHYIPHAFPKHVYFELKPEERKQLSVQNFGPRADWFKALWVNRNATRKMPADLLDCWRVFLEKLEAKHGHRDAMLIMHTDPNDTEGPNLLAVAERLGLQNNVWFSTEKLQFDKMNILHNLVDTTVNISKNEGFGLSTLISLQVGKPVVALKTGGETSKVVDSRDGSELGVGIDPIKRSLVGSQLVPYIYEDFAGTEDVANAFLKLYEMEEDEWNELSAKCKDYVDYAFKHEDIVKKWDETMSDCIAKFKEKPKRWDIQPINPQTPGSNTSVEAVERDPAKLEAAKQAQAMQQAVETQKFLEENLQPQAEATAKPKSKGKKRVAKKQTRATSKGKKSQKKRK